MIRVKKAKKRAVKKPVKRKKASTLPKEGEYMGLTYESFCELSLLYFAEELKQLGYVDRVERSPSYVLCEPVNISYAIQLKKGSKIATQTVSNGVTYTPDYDIYFTKKALGIFCWDMNSGIKWDKHLLVSESIGGMYRACCEVKPDFSRNSTTPKSVQSMKWLYQKHGVFVNLFRPNRVFEGLFVPEKYKYTERGTPRKLNFKAKNIHEYLKAKQ